MNIFLNDAIVPEDIKSRAMDSTNKSERLNPFKEISSWVSSVQDLDNLLELILESAAQMINAKASSLLILDRDTNTLYFKAATGEKKHEIKKYRVKLGQGIAGSVATSGKPLLIPDVRKDKRWYAEISKYIAFETRSIACVPLKMEGKIIGVVQVVDKVDASPMTKRDLNLLGEFAGLAALAIANARMIERVKKENLQLKEVLGDQNKIVGKSPALQAVISDATKVANSNATTLILGESGTGKELLARLIHQSSPRKDKLLVTLNCAAMPETLLEDELFGHEKGAFTGASSRKIGKFELAHQGTIFLDEIGEMTAGMQAKLLRVVQEGMFYRIGGNTPIFVDVRVLSATNKNLAREVAEGTFREDLFYRLNVVQIDMPSLRERKEDIAPLALHFLDVFKKDSGLTGLSFSKGALKKMTDHDWPGNIRELRNAVERAVVMGNGKTILPEDLPIVAIKSRRLDLPRELTLKEAVDQFKKEFILSQLKQTGGNRSKAAKRMNIQRTYLSRLISQYGIQE